MIHTPRAFFFYYCGFALLINFIPFVSVPFLYLTTIFHELSHGIAALITGGQIEELALQLNGAGHLVSLGGSQLLITFSGYFGAPLWGALLYLSAERLQIAKFTFCLLIAMFMLTLLLWASSFITVVILLSVGLLLIALLKFTQYKIFNHMVRFIAVVVLFNAIYSPLYLLFSEHGDSYTLAQITMIPAIVWVLIWLVWGLFVLFKLCPKNTGNS